MDRFDAMALIVPDLNPKLREQFAGILRQIAEDEREACAKLCDDFADKAMKWTHEEKDKDAANSFRGQRIAAANLAGQIRNRTT